MEYGHVRGFGRLNMLTTGKVAAVLGMHPDTIRNYERKGIFPTAKRSLVDGYRLWATEDLARMNALVRCRRESLKKTGLDKPIGAHGDQLENRWWQPRVGSNPTFGTTYFKNRIAPG